MKRISGLSKVSGLLRSVVVAGAAVALLGAACGGDDWVADGPGVGGGYGPVAGPGAGGGYGPEDGPGSGDGYGPLAVDKRADMLTALLQG